MLKPLRDFSAHSPELWTQILRKCPPLPCGKKHRKGAQFFVSEQGFMPKLGSNLGPKQHPIGPQAGLLEKKASRFNGTLAEACGSRTHLRSPRRARTAALKAARTTGPLAPPSRNYSGRGRCVQLFGVTPANFLRASSSSLGSVHTS
jgi:hypothetical protein